MNKITVGIITALIMASSVFTGQAAASTVLYYTSSEDSWVGQGETATITPSQGFTFLISRNYDQGVSFWIDNFATSPNPSLYQWWHVDFAAPYEALIQAGHYAGATRFAFQDPSEPGLDFGGNGRGNNTLLGYFDVYEAVYGMDGGVLSFAADFVQYDSGNEDAWSMGSVRYNSDYPIPEPSTIMLLLAGLPLLGLKAKLNR